MGRFFNAYNKPCSGQLIISQGNELKTFINSEDGNYRFLLEYGKYDVRFRSDTQPVQIYYNFIFEEGKGFFTELLKHKIVGISQGTINNLMINNQLTNNLPIDNWTSPLR